MHPTQLVQQETGKVHSKMFGRIFFFKDVWPNFFGHQSETFSRRFYEGSLNAKSSSIKLVSGAIN
jgi:hypothetical protein